MYEATPPYVPQSLRTRKWIRRICPPSWRISDNPEHNFRASVPLQKYILAQLHDHLYIQCTRFSSTMEYTPSYRPAFFPWISGWLLLSPSLHISPSLWHAPPPDHTCRRRRHHWLQSVESNWCRGHMCNKCACKWGEWEVRYILTQEVERKNTCDNII